MPLKLSVEYAFGNPPGLSDIIMNQIEAAMRAAAQLPPEYDEHWSTSLVDYGNGRMVLEVVNRHHDDEFKPNDVGGPTAYRTLRDDGVTTFGELASRTPAYLREALGLCTDVLNRIHVSLCDRHLVGPL